MMMPRLQVAAVALAAIAATAPALPAQVTPAGAPAARAESVVVTPNATYRGTEAGRMLFGDHYRVLWTTPIRVPLLSLAHYAGGLRPTARGGSMQTKALRFAGADGREYVFRSVDKDPTMSLPPDLRETYAREIVRDLVSAEHPAGAVVVARLLDGVGVLHATPQLVVMPDDAALGAFRAEFAGMLGWIEVRPTEESEQGPGFADATRLVSSQKLLERLAAHPEERVDARAYLKARLLDLLVGDWDRHAEQWRWARLPGESPNEWQPIPRDRDWALVRLDGLVWSLVRFAYPYPQFVSFEPRLPDMVWLTWNGRFLDRRFLAALDRPAWDSVTHELGADLTDSLIDAAARALPPELYAISGPELASTLRWRRDRLDAFASAFYRVLAEESEVHCTDASELVEIDRVDDRFTDVAVHPLNRSGAPRSRATFSRRFDAVDTREVRIYLHGGDDRVVMRGERSGATLVRVIGGGGRNTYLDSAAGGRATHAAFQLYDSEPASRLVTPTGATIDRRHYRPPPTRRWFEPPRDWGDRWRPWPWLGYTPDIGLFIGGGPLYERYGFRHDPYAYRMTLRVGYATGVNRWRAEYDADFRRSGSSVHATLFARASGIDVVHYYGPGNDTRAPASRAFYRVDQEQYAFEPTLVTPLSRSLTLGFGATLRQVNTSGDSGQFVTGVLPYGAGTFRQAGARLHVAFDTRDRVEYPTRGLLVATQGTAYPSLGSVSRPYAALRSQVATYLSAPGYLEPTLALRIGGDRLWGRFPFFDAAFVGGSSSVRGWNEQRFAGDASLYGNAEVRVFLTKFFFLLPGDLGAFALADAGRVYVAGERSDAVHSGFGGGLWVAPLGRSNTLSIAWARSRESSGIYFRTGVAY